MLNKALDPPAGSIATGAEYVDNEGCADEVEHAVMQYFDVSPDYLRTSKLYNFYDEDTGRRYDDAYLLPFGFGGGGSARALDFSQDKNTLTITVGVFGPDDAVMPVLTGTLTVYLGESGFEYVSYILH